MRERLHRPPKTKARTFFTGELGLRVIIYKLAFCTSVFINTVVLYKKTTKSPHFLIIFCTNLFLCLPIAYLARLYSVAIAGFSIP